MKLEIKRPPQIHPRFTSSQEIRASQETRISFVRRKLRTLPEFPGKRASLGAELLAAVEI